VLNWRLPFETEVMICTGKDLIDAASLNPFGRGATTPDVIRFVSVLAKPPKVLPSIPAQIPENSKWLLKVLSVHNKFLFGMYRREMKAIGCLGQLDKLFGAPATTRNWNTICAILKVLEKN
jgi:uncharacterized protein (DUF1697 family)